MLMGDLFYFSFSFIMTGDLFFVALNFQTLSEDERVHGQLLRRRGLVVRGLPCGEPRSRVQGFISLFIFFNFYFVYTKAINSYNFKLHHEYIYIGNWSCVWNKMYNMAKQLFLKKWLRSNWIGCITAIKLECMLRINYHIQNWFD